ncbi:hypothetical protein BgAZ_206060 [Babesia gibsoni]|uniref:Uncharacterized protein n=1 Tax=Babesia gibsoni TaxID=33632 RepID=A0AAD8P9L9_BABGI|nr:hypothetical protein BgAZ_206060 [Babesia gibsoni]
MLLRLVTSLVFASSTAAFIHSRSDYRCAKLPRSSLNNGCYAKSLLDDPLLLAPSTEPGKDHEVVVSNSPAFGLQRTLYRHKLNVRSRGPLFNPGDSAYMASGPYRNSRATVLSVFKRAPGEPFWVNVVLDCRNERGILKAALAKYHGTRVTVVESQLTPRPLFSPYSPPPLSVEDNYMASIKRLKGRESKLDTNIIGKYMYRVINASSVAEIKTVFDTIRRFDDKYEFPYDSILVQLARAVNIGLDGDTAEVLTNELLACLSVTVEKPLTDKSRTTLPWAVWALHTLHKKHLVKEFEAYGSFFNTVRRLLMTNRLGDLTQGEVALLASGFWSSPFPRTDVYNRLAMIFSYFPANAVDTKHAAVLAGALARERIEHPGFTKLLCEVVREQKHIFSPSSAVYVLDYLAMDPEVPQEVRDVLYACCSVADLLKPDASPQGPLIRQAVLLARLNKSEMDELCIAFRSESLHVPLSEILWTMSTLLLSPNTAELYRLLIIRASHDLEKLGDKELRRLVHISSKMKECPIELVDALENYLRKRWEGRRIEAFLLRVFSSILTKIPPSRQSCQMLILEHIERFINDSLCLLNDGAIDEAGKVRVISNVIECLQHIPMTGYEMPNMAAASANIIRKCVKYSPNRVKTLISILSIQAMCTSYFEDASNAACSLLSGPDNKLSEDVSPLTELLLMVKATLEGEGSVRTLKERLNLEPLPSANINYSKAPPQMDVRDVPLMFSLLVRSHLLDDCSGVLNKLYVFAEENLSSLSNADLVLMRDGLVAVGAFDEKWTALIDSIPKGIDVITTD